MVLTPLTNFPLRAEENTQITKQGTRCKFYFYHVFLKVLHWTLEMRLWQPWENISAGNPMFLFNDRKISYKYFCFQKNFWKWSTAQVGYGFENHASLFCWKTKFFFLKFKIDWKNNFSRLISPFFSLRTMIGGLTHLTKEICKKGKEITQTPKMITEKENFSEREIIFPQNISLEARIPVVKTLNKTFLLKALFFSSRSPKKFAILFNFKKKNCFSSKIFEGP